MEPLNAISIGCRQIEESKNLKDFENTCADSEQPYQFRNQIKQMRAFSDLMMYRLKDMRDF